MTTTAPKPSRELEPEGSRVWKVITAEYELDPAELLILEAACRQADDLFRLEVLLARDGASVPGSNGQPRLSSIVTELRHGRLAYGKLIDQLSLPDMSTGISLTPAQKKAQKAGLSRWQRQIHRDEQASAR